MRALQLIADRKLVLADVPDPPPPGDGEVQIRIKAVALNHLDVWGFRGMAANARITPNPVPCFRCRSKIMTSIESRLTLPMASPSDSAVPTNSTAGI